MRNAAFLVLNVVGTLALATPAAAENAQKDDIGTRPAHAPLLVDGAEPSGEKLRLEDHPPPRDLVVAQEPPKDWYVLDAGLRTHRDTFVGLATLALAQSRTERLYGVTSLALIRNDAGSHFGLTQLAIGRNLSDEFGSLAQVGLAKPTRYFYGLGQVTGSQPQPTISRPPPARRCSRAESFGGLLQWRLQLADESFAGALQSAATAARKATRRSAQISVFNGQEGATERRRRQRALGLGPVGVINYASRFAASCSSVG
jgi:hypothetical protein